MNQTLFKPFPIADDVRKVLIEMMGEEETDEFIDYWEESDARGKQRWQGQKYFDIMRRARTWKKNSSTNFGKVSVFESSLFDVYFPQSGITKKKTQEEIENYKRSNAIRPDSSKPKTYIFIGSI